MNLYESSRQEAAILDHVQIDRKIKAALLLREAEERKSHMMLKIVKNESALWIWGLIGLDLNLTSTICECKLIS